MKKFIKRIQNSKLAKRIGSSKPRLIIISGCLALVGALLVSLSYASGPELYLKSVSSEVVQGSMIEVDVRVNTGGKTVNAVQANMSYPADKLELVSIDSSASPFTVEAENEGSNGSIKIARGNISPLNGDLALSKLTFRVLMASGSAAVDFAEGSAILDSETNTNILSSTSGQTYTAPAPEPEPQPDTTPPSAPANLNASDITVNSAKLSWNASTDNKAVVGYEVYRSPGLGTTSGYSKITEVTQTTYTDTAVVEKGVYEYYITAFDEARNISSPSNTISVTIPSSAPAPEPDPLPQAVLSIEPVTQELEKNSSAAIKIYVDTAGADVNALQANLAYPADKLEFVSVDSSGSAFGIEAEASGGNGLVKIGRGSIEPKSGKLLVATVNFKAITGSGSAAISFSEGSSVLRSSDNIDILGSTNPGSINFTDTQPAPTLPSKITGLQASSVTLTSVKLSWNKDQNSDGYGVQMTQAGYDSWWGHGITTTDTTYTLSFTFQPDTEYSFRVRGQNSSGTGEYSDPITIKSPPAEKETTPPTVSITNPINGDTVSNTVNVTASASDNVGVSKVEFYVNGSHHATDTSAPYAYSWNTTVIPNGSYKLDAKAYDAAGNTSISSVTVSVLNGDTTPPTAPVLSATTEATKVVLSWTPSTDNVGVAGYWVQRDGQTISTQYTARTATTSYQDTSILPGATYSYRVVAFDAAGNYAPSNTVSTTIPTGISDTTPPSAPTGLYDTAKHTTYINLAWNASTDNVGVSGYEVFRDNQKIATVHGASNTSFGDGTVSGNKMYTYYVKAFDAAGNVSGNSNTINVFSHHRKNR